MNIKKMQCFNQLVKTQNFTRAAEAEFITQPAFSRMIASFENDVGAQLVKRDKYSVTITHIGRKVFEYTKRICDEYERMKRLAMLSKNGELGNFRFGILDSDLISKTVQILKTFRMKYPEVMLEFKTYTEIELLKALSREEVDTVSSVHFPEVYKNIFDSYTVETSNLCFLTYKEHPLAKRNAVSISELLNESFVVIDEERSEYGYNVFMNQCLDNGFIPKVTAHADSLSNLFRYIECQIGSAIIVDKVMEVFYSDLVRVPILGYDPFRIFILWNKHSKNPLVDKYVEHIKEMSK